MKDVYASDFDDENNATIMVQTSIDTLIYDGEVRVYVNDGVILQVESVSGNWSMS